MVGVNFDLTSMLPNKNADRALSYQREQQIADNQFRNMAFQTQQEWNWRMWNDRKFSLQNLVRDAAKAGISPLAALGSPGQSPMNITIPPGQGGRVAGTYSRKNPVAIQAQAQIGAQTAAETARASMYNAQADLYYWQARNFEDKWTQGRYDATIPGRKEDRERESLYIKVKDNTPEASRWKSEGYVPLNNPNLNLEMPESIGGGYWAAPRLGVDDTPQKTVPYWGP